MELKNLFGAVLLAVGTMLTASCSVKENREDCPCRLGIIFDGYVHEPLSARFLDTQSLEPKAQFNNVLFDAGTGMMEIREANVPRRQLLAVACSGIRENNYDGRKVMIPLGSEMDSVSSAVRFLDARMENATLVVTLGKQFCRLKVVFMDDSYSPAVRVSGNVSGLDTYSSTPISGLFSFTAVSAPFTVNVPRQLDDSLLLEVLGDDGEPAETLPLGEFISETGYSWAAESLADCTVLIDRARAEIRILINDWEEGGSFSLKY